MVQINLLPVSEKKKRKVKVELQIRLRPILFVLIVVILVIMGAWVFSGMRVVDAQKELAQLDEQLKLLKSNLEGLNQLNADKKSLQSKLEFLNRELKREIFWSRNLNHLSKLVPQGVWFKKIVLHTKKEDNLNRYVKLDINGSAISLHNEQMIDLIGAFMVALKKDEVFSDQFSDIRLISSKSGKTGEMEIMDFKILCKFR